MVLGLLIFKFTSASRHLKLRTPCLHSKQEGPVGPGGRRTRANPKPRVIHSPEKTNRAGTRAHTPAPRQPTREKGMTGRGRGEPQPADWPAVPGYEVLGELGRGGM